MEPDPPDALTEPRLPPLVVMVVEDDPTSRQVLFLLLQEMGVRPVAAEDGRDALARLTQTEVDVVLMDYQMPHLDGLEVTRRLRRQIPHPGPVVIALTGEICDDVDRRCREAGMDDFLQKPVSATELSRTLQRWSAGR